MSAIIIKNLSEVLAAVKGTTSKIEEGAQIGIMRAGLAVERQAKLNFQGTRSYEKRVSKRRQRLFSYYAATSSLVDQGLIQLQVILSDLLKLLTALDLVITLLKLAQQ